MKFPSRRALLIGLILVALALAGVAGMGALRGRDAEAKAAAAAKSPTLEFVPDDLYAVRLGTLARTLPVTGTLMALTAATVKAKVAGELVEVTVREGQSVQKGQLLARIDQTEVQAKVAARSADAEAARAQLKLAEKNRITQKALLDKNFISQNAFDTTQSGYDVAVARLRAAEADLLSARKTLGDSSLVAPFSGIVSERHAQPGERVPLDAKIVSIVDLSVLTLEASVPASTIAQVKVGQPVAFRVDGFGERRFDGRIDRINPATAAGSRSISVYAIIENKEALLRGGLFAQGDLILEKIENAVIVPATAVREEIGQTFVYAIDAGTLRKRPVRVGQSDSDGMLQVLSGLAAGDSVVKNNLGQLRDGSPVLVGGRAAAAAAGK
ncbi:MAG: efflux RND transporter periplasmic adaptor subunit [Proteobacteria bacterium]|nr:efflux RND transporter periplasmic adaptor subunit [Pseudomonadota bacterium]